ncbi:unnamed protein product [Paramecium sonneborni]|uniref:Uncharacterized protein n=1 Tax=Paramecium sonneborni TaxID=65129 RepID=A0A8S1QMG3_9CILI|nr:unnamed protein product [Paramecium sonneborni]
MVKLADNHQIGQLLKIQVVVCNLVTLIQSQEDKIILIGVLKFIKHLNYPHILKQISNLTFGELIYGMEKDLLSQSIIMNESSSNICGQSGYSDSKHFLSLSISHQSSSALVLIKGLAYYWGISEFKLLIEECPAGCQFCNEFGCLISQGDPQCLFYQALETRDLNQYIQRDSFDLQSEVMVANKVLKECKKGWIYHIQLNRCISIFGDSFVTSIEECDDGNNIPYDGCHNCKFSCSEFQCLSCFNSLCYLCLYGWDLINYQCQQISGEQLLKMYLNNQNQLQQINTYLNQDNAKQNLQYININEYEQSCQLECLYCLNKQCYFCLDGWALVNYQCEQKCGDQLLAIFSKEQCDDGNDINGDGCC